MKFVQKNHHGIIIVNTYRQTGGYGSSKNKMQAKKTWYVFKARHREKESEIDGGRLNGGGGDLVLHGKETWFDSIKKWSVTVIVSNFKAHLTHRIEHLKYDEQF